ncbi:MAG: hypothetical protein JWN67_5049 [Actinomycetia bacterium]|nr:hypothetical protein [Actinomycetes bacterium]
MAPSTISTIPPIPVDAGVAPWAVTDEDVFGTDAAILRHDFPSRIDGDGFTWNRRVEYLLPRRGLPVDFDGNEASVNVDPSAVVRWSTFEDHVKADVVFSAKPAALELWFAANFVGLTALEDEGAISLIDPVTGELVGWLPRPFLLDGLRERHDLAWHLGDGCLTVELPDLADGLWLGAVFDPTTVDTSTTLLATAYSNQKKIARLSTGVLVVVIAATLTNAEFWYSTDNGATWTQYASGTSDIAGWVNGSISPYVDSGGTERMTAVWKQSGTGGGRTNNDVYVAVGTFNAGLTTLTWSIAVLNGGGWGNYNYPDIVGHAEGTGGMAHVIIGGLSGTTNLAVAQKITISSAGAITAQATHFTGTDYLAGVHVFPSITIVPSDKRLLAIWSAGTTGAGKGVRSRTVDYATWSTGGAWAAEVEVDNTVYISDANNEGLICRWDAARSLVVAGGQLFTGSVYKVMVWDSSSFTSFTNRVSTTVALSAAILGPGMAIDATTGHVYLFGCQFSGGTYNNVGYYKATRSGSSLTLGLLVVTDTFTGGANSPHVNGLATTSAIRWLYTAGSGTPTVKVDAIALNTAPTAPTWTTTAGPKDVNASLNLLATNNDPDPGDTVSAYALKRVIGATTRWHNGTDFSATVLTWVTDTDLDVTLASGWGADSDADHSYYFAAKDAAGLGDPPVYSAALVITPSVKVNPAIDLPVDAGTVPSSTYNATWTVAQQSAYLLELLNAAGTIVLWTAGGVPGAYVVDSVPRTRTIDYTLANGTSYKLRLTTKNTEGLVSTADVNSFAVSYTPPATATGVLVASNTPGHLVLTITNPAPGGGQPAVAHNEIYRRTVAEGIADPTYGGVPHKDGTNVANNGTFTDVLVGHYENLEYRILVVGVNGTTSWSAWIS